MRAIGRLWVGEVLSVRSSSAEAQQSLLAAISTPAPRSRSTSTSPSAVAGVSTPASSGSRSRSSTRLSADVPQRDRGCPVSGRPAPSPGRRIGRRSWWWWWCRCPSRSRDVHREVAVACVLSLGPSPGAGRMRSRTYRVGGRVGGEAVVADGVQGRAAPIGDPAAGPEIRPRACR